MNQCIHPLLELVHLDAIQESVTMIVDDRPPAIARECGVPDPFFNDLRYPLDKKFPLLGGQSRGDRNRRSRQCTHSPPPRSIVSSPLPTNWKPAHSCSPEFPYV